MATPRTPQRSGAPWWLVAALAAVVIMSMTLGAYHHFTLSADINHLKRDREEASGARSDIMRELGEIRSQVDSVTKRLDPYLTNGNQQAPASPPR